MKRYKRILVPVDGSRLSDIAFERALEFARLVEGDVTIINVAQHILPPPGPGTMQIDMDEKKIAKDVIDKYVERASKSDVKVNSIVKEGNPADVIVSMSHDNDLVIMGTRGHNPLATILLGSVAEKVARESCCPVMLIREKKDDCRR